MHRHLLYNGEVRETSEALVSPGQTGYMNGWGVFSTIRVYDGVLFAFERHYRRMERDARLMHVPFPFSMDEIQAQLLTLVEANEAFNSTLRVVITRNRGGAFEGAGIRQDADLVAFTTGLTDWGTGVRLYYVEQGRHAASPFSGVKVMSWLQNLTWNEEAHQRGFDEVVLLNEHGQVSECTSANIFAIRGNEVWTPPVQSGGCLPGVTRALLLEEIRVPGLQVMEHDLTPAELESADTAFITSTTRNLLPVLEIEGRSLRTAGEAFERLSKAFSDYQLSYVAARAGKGEAVRR